MISLAKENADRWHQLAWWLCATTLPWIDKANNGCVILLVLLWISDGKFKEKWQRLKSSAWAWPFLLYYLVLLIGMIYTPNKGNGLFTLDKKFSFLALPLIVATGRSLDPKFIVFLKRNFVYSCIAVVLLCLVTATYYFVMGSSISNFDIRTNENFISFHPEASTVWMHFSYIQLAHWAALHPGYLSLYLVFCLVILLHENYSGRVERNIHILLGCLIICFLSLLTTRIAIIAFIFSALYMGIKKIGEKQHRAYLLIASASLILGFMVWLNPVARFRLIEEPLITRYRANQTVLDWNSISYRLLEWQGSWSVIRSNWLAGVGTGGSKMAMDNFYAHFNSSTIGLEHNAHNQYLQVWMESGLLGLFVFLLCLWGGLFQLRKDSSYVCFILIFSLMCLTESIGERQKGIIFFTFFQVLFLGFANKKE